jgi:hypothetical protein
MDGMMAEMPADSNDTLPRSDEQHETPATTIPRLRTGREEKLQCGEHTKEWAGGCSSAGSSGSCSSERWYIC